MIVEKSCTPIATFTVICVPFPKYSFYLFQFHLYYIVLYNFSRKNETIKKVSLFKTPFPPIFHYFFNPGHSWSFSESVSNVPSVMQYPSADGVP